MSLDLGADMRATAVPKRRPPGRSIGPERHPDDVAAFLGSPGRVADASHSAAPASYDWTDLTAPIAMEERSSPDGA